MKKIQGNRTLRVRFRVRFLQVSFILFQTRPALTRDVTCSVTLLGWKRHEEAISDDNPPYYFSSFCINQSYYVCNCNHHCFHGCITYCRFDFFFGTQNLHVCMHVYACACFEDLRDHPYYFVYLQSGSKCVPCTYSFL